MVILITGTPQFSHYCTIIPAILHCVNGGEIKKILTPGESGNGINNAVKIFAHYNGIPCETFKELTLEVFFSIDAAILFWDGVEEETKNIIDLVGSKDVILHTISVPFQKEKWYHKLKKQKNANLSSKRSHNLSLF